MLKNANRWWLLFENPMSQMKGGVPSERYSLDILRILGFCSPRTVIPLLAQLTSRSMHEDLYGFMLWASYAGNQMPWVVVEVQFLPVLHPPAVDLIWPSPWCTSRPAVDGSFP